MHRIWGPGFPARPATEFNPGYGAPTRFAPLNIPVGATAGNREGTLYAALDFEAAIFETVLRNLPMIAAGEVTNSLRFVRRKEVDKLSYAVMRLEQDVKLADLNTQALHLWGLTQENMISSYGDSAYAQTVLWAERLYECFADVQGLHWPSRQFGTKPAMMFFKNRMSANPFTLLNTETLANGAGKALFDQTAADYMITVAP